MNLTRIYAVILRQAYLMRGSVARILPLFTWVLIDIVLWGFITKYLTSITPEGPNYVSLFLGAVLLWDFLTRVMQGVTMAFFEDVWSRNFFNLFASPLTVPEYLCGLVFTSIATSAIGLVVMLIVASSVFGLSYMALGGALTFYLSVLFLFGIALGVWGCALVLRFGPAAEWFIWPIPALLSPFACVFYPLEMLPHWMQWVAYLLPPTYVFESMRMMVDGQAVESMDGAIGLAMAAIYLMLACWTFTRVYATALRTGLIARYSAEGLG